MEENKIVTTSNDILYQEYQFLNNQNYKNGKLTKYNVDFTIAYPRTKID